METGTRLTAKGAAMRNKIVAAAADLVLARGVGATTLDDIRAGTGTSKSQLFHYFPGGKADLVKAIALFQAERVFDAQRPHLDELDTWSSWERWREAVVAHYGAQRHWGCPIGAMVSELAGSNPALAAIPKRHMDRWRRYLRDGLVRMRRARALRADVDVEQLSWSIVASLQGGLLLTQATRSLVPLRASLDGALDALRANARRTGSLSTAHSRSLPALGPLPIHEPRGDESALETDAETD